MHQASVGFHCPECVKGTAQQVHRGVPTFDPIATKVLIGLNVLAFLWSTVQSGTPMRISNEALKDGGLFATAIDPVAVQLIGVTEGEWYRLITSGFLHNGLIHLGFNMYGLWILGPVLERSLDRFRFVALYFTSMLGGAAGVMLLDPDIPTVGASGAVFGMFGAVAVIQRASGSSIWASGIGQVLALNLFLTFTISSISVGGHVGGLLAGGIVGVIYVALSRARRSDWIAFGLAVGIGGALAVAAVALASNPVF
jgi:membrane associated rhomboid family serine protease